MKCRKPCKVMAGLSSFGCNSGFSGAKVLVSSGFVTDEEGDEEQAAFLAEEVEEQLRNFRLLVKHSLRSPYAFITHHYFPYTVEDRLKLVDMYYAFDPTVFRLFFTHKLSHSSLEMALKDASSKGSHSGGEVALLMHCIENVGEYVIRRQLDNLKHVCTTVPSMYHCKGDLYIPREVPLRIAVAKCFGFSKELSLPYCAAVFSHEHFLSSKFLERFTSCELCYSLYSVISTCCCDESGLFLRNIAGKWKAVGRQLEETRILAEMHMNLFGEPLRPRWQQQLDGGVQRVIGVTSSSPDFNSSANDRGGFLGGSTASPVSAGATAGGGHTTANCANSKFSRRFCHEYTLIMKVCSKVAFFLSSAQLNDALDCFYTRVLHPLENMSLRSVSDAASPPWFTSTGSPSSPVAGVAPPLKSAFPTADSEKEEAKKGSKGSSGFDDSAKVVSPPSGTPPPPTDSSPVRLEAHSPVHSLLRGSFCSTSMMQSMEKTYLVELCGLLTRLPQCYCAAVMEESREGEAFESLMVMLKSLTQLWLAGDD